MKLEIIDVVSSGAGTANEDRAGAHGALAWVIDGATDVIQSPLAGEISDAHWLAVEIERGLRLDDAGTIDALCDLPARLASGLADSFARAQRRAPIGREEHPSASGVIVRLKGTALEYVSLGDCALIAEDGTGLQTLGVEEDTSGDRWVREVITADRRANPGSPQKQLRENLWPKLRAARAAMNTPGGYGVFSITPPPAHFIRSGALTLEPGASVLLASDGLTRLVDVFGSYDARKLFNTARAHGLASLVGELRQIETTDSECISFPRAKISDDATGMLLRVAGR
jgi:hypothetical protein